MRLLKQFNQDIVELIVCFMALAVLASLASGPYVAIERGTCTPRRIVEYFPTHYILCYLFLDFKR